MPSGSWTLLRGSTSSELLQIVILRRQNDVRSRNLVLTITDERLLLALHRSVEIVEVRVLPEARGIGLRSLGIGLGADDLRLLRALRTD